MAGPLDALEKKFKPLKDRLLGFTKKDIEYKLNDLKTYVERLKAQGDAFAEKVAEAKQTGTKGTQAKDFAKDKEAKKPFNEIQVTYDNIVEGVDELQKLAKDGPRLRKDLNTVRLEASRFSGAPKDVKTAKSMVKEIDEFIEGVDAGAAAPGKIPKEAIDVGKKKVEEYYADCMKAADKLPKKEVKPLPKEYDKVAFARLQKDVNDKTRKLKAAPDSYDKLKKSGKTDEAESFIDDLKVTGEELAQLAESLRKVQKDYSLALRSAPHAKEFPLVEEQARRLSIGYKAMHRKLSGQKEGA